MITQEIKQIYLDYDPQYVFFTIEMLASDPIGYSYNKAIYEVDMKDRWNAIRKKVNQYKPLGNCQFEVPEREITISRAISLPGCSAANSRTGSIFLSACRGEAAGCASTPDCDLKVLSGITGMSSLRDGGQEEGGSVPHSVRHGMVVRGTKRADGHMVFWRVDSTRGRDRNEHEAERSEAK